jgi:hypothetical protein
MVDVMLEIVRAYTVPDAYRIQLALQAAGIEAIVGGLTLSGQFANPYTVSLVHEPDAERAKAVLRDLEAKDR